MAEARLTIRIEDDTPEQTGVASASNQTPTVGSPATGTAPPPAGRAWTTAQQLQNQPQSQAAGHAWSELSFDAKRKASLGGRPADVTDREWEQFGRENQRRGRESARISMHAAEEAKRRKEAEEERLRKEEEKRRAEEERERERQEKQRARYAQIATTAAVSSDKGKYQQAGSALGAIGGEAIGAAVGGPVGAAVGSVVGQQVGETIGKRLDEPFKEVKQAIDLARDAAVRIAGNDGFGAVTLGLDAAADGLEQIPIAGTLAADGLRVFTKALTAVDDVLHAFTARGRELGGYSAEIAASSARQEVMLLQADLEEAKKMGSQYAKMIELETQWQIAWRDTMMPIKEVIVDFLPKAMKLLIDTGIGIGVLVYGMTVGMVDIITPLVAIRARLDAAGAAPSDWDLVRALIDTLGGIADPFGPRNPVRGAPAPVPPIVAEF